eukprot:TRINITY_DN4865_c0_g1_i2.p1 TRINITY_DN4865_c0_g1~~TRINITY_DN4865_c0_g1_i2.p1  ORF type:complete len:504 (+),score=88.68 TRINITY_DN4865_c0_g1_i2:29-1513(+)
MKRTLEHDTANHTSATSTPKECNPVATFEGQQVRERPMPRLDGPTALQEHPTVSQGPAFEEGRNGEDDGLACKQADSTARQDSTREGLVGSREEACYVAGEGAAVGSLGAHVPPTSLAEMTSALQGNTAASQDQKGCQGHPHVHPEDPAPPQEDPAARPEDQTTRPDDPMPCQETAPMEEPKGEGELQKDSQEHLSVGQKQCKICNAPGKYRCPRCDLVSCSLNCCKLHKIENNCSGKRDKARFVPLNEFTDSVLHSDYHLLTELAQQVTKQKKKRYTNKTKPHPHSYRWQLLQNNAEKQKTILELLPPHASRRRQNKSIFDCKVQKIMWSVDWKFGEFTVFKDTQDESILVKDLLKSVLSEENTKQQIDNYFQNEPNYENWKVLMRVEHLPANSPEYFNLDINCTLKECLSNKVIIEYPILHVVTPNHTESYPITTHTQSLITQDSENGLLTELTSLPHTDQEQDTSDPAVLCDILQDALVKDSIITNIPLNT